MQANMASSFHLLFFIFLKHIFQHLVFFNFQCIFKSKKSSRFFSTTIWHSKIWCTIIYLSSSPLIDIWVVSSYLLLHKVACILLYKRFAHMQVYEWANFKKIEVLDLRLHTFAILTDTTNYNKLFNTHTSDA